MDIKWIRYASKKGQKYVLVLHVGDAGDKTLALVTEEIPANEVDIIRVHVEELERMALDERVMWLKVACPQAMSKAYRTLHRSKMSVLNTYQIGKILKG